MAMMNIGVPVAPLLGAQPHFSGIILGMMGQQQVFPNSMQPQVPGLRQTQMFAPIQPGFPGMMNQPQFPGMMAGMLPQQFPGLFILFINNLLSSTSSSITLLKNDLSTIEM